VKELVRGLPNHVVRLGLRAGAHECDKRILVVEDLDGNQLFFNYPNEPGVDPEGLRRT
jgi:hypothetical protein